MIWLGFNHPMVKVKVISDLLGWKIDPSFNHPMVKVKAEREKDISQQRNVSTTLW